MEMKSTQRVLMIAFAVPIILSLLMVALFETDVLPCGLLAGQGEGQAEFLIAVTMELVTIMAIPVALKMFRLKFIATRLTTPRALMRWGLLRLLLLGVPMVVNALSYYLFMGAAFGYLGIILLLCMVFVTPTKARCYSEVTPADAQ